MSPSQIILSIVVVFIIVKTAQARRKDNIPLFFTIVWVCFWFVGLFLLLRLNVLSELAALVGVGRGVDLAIYLSVILIFYLIYILFVKIQKLEQKLTTLARNKTLSKFAKKPNKIS